MDLLRHRVAVAGGDFDTLFWPSTHRLFYAATRGVPRDLCILGNAALVAAFSRGQRTVDEAVLRHALADLSFKDWPNARPNQPDERNHEPNEKLTGAA
jgi:hypothetical protein